MITFVAMAQGGGYWAHRSTGGVSPIVLGQMLTQSDIFG